MKYWYREIVEYFAAPSWWMDRFVGRGISKPLRTWACPAMQYGKFKSFGAMRTKFLGSLFCAEKVMSVSRKAKKGIAE